MEQTKATVKVRLPNGEEHDYESDAIVVVALEGSEVKGTTYIQSSPAAAIDIANGLGKVLCNIITSDPVCAALRGEEKE